MLDESNRDLSMSTFPRDEIEFFFRTGLARDVTIPNQKAPRDTKGVSGFWNRGRISDYDDTEWRLCRA